MGRAAVVFAVVAFFGARATMVMMDDSQLKGAVASAPMLSNSTRVLAENVGGHIKRECAAAGCELVPGTLRVDVSDTRETTVGQTTMKMNVQDINFAFTCKRRNAFFLRTDMSTQVKTTVPGDGAEDHLVE